jgi:hypothetical protein
MQSYQEFIKRKSQLTEDAGFEPLYMPDFLFDFQKYLFEWALKKGRAAIFSDTGTGKTPMQLTFAQNVVMKTNKPVIILTPLAVSYQTVKEGEKFGIDCKVSREGKIEAPIIVTNYERLHYFNPDDYAGVVLDESSAIKAFDGKRRKQIIRFMSKIQYRLLCSATPAPNDWPEIGTASESLGDLTQSQMIDQFFKSSDNMRHSLFKEGDFWNRAKYFFRAHSEIPFWKWVSSWARAMRLPADLGFDNGAFILPPLKIRQHMVRCHDLLSGELFPKVATTLKEQREERKLTLQKRCEATAELVMKHDCSVVWCQYNPEGELLAKMIPDSVEVAGRHSDEEKENRLIAFSKGEIPRLVTKPKVAAWGMNWQHCGHHTFFPSHSFEQYYQAVRRSHRFGRTESVNVDIITTEGEAGVTANLKKKQDKCDKMFAALVYYMGQGMHIKIEDNHKKEMEVAEWL